MCASRAAEMGLVNQVVPSAELCDASEVLAKIAEKSSLTVATGKLAFYQQRNGFGGGLPLCFRNYGRNMLARDAKEGIVAIERRTPDWCDE